MTVPLIVLALSRHSVDLHFRAKLPHAAVERKVAIFVPALAIAALIAGSGLAIAFYRNRAE